MGNNTEALWQEAFADHENGWQALGGYSGFFTFLCAPFFVPRLLSAPPSDRVLHASFGAGGMARSDLGSISSYPNVQLVAVADVEPARGEDLKKKWPDLRIYNDWRVLLDKERELT